MLNVFYHQRVWNSTLIKTRKLRHYWELAWYIRNQLIDIWRRYYYPKWVRTLKIGKQIFELLLIFVYRSMWDLTLERTWADLQDSLEFFQICYAWFTFLSRQYETRRERECEGYHSSRLPHLKPVLISSQSSQRHVGKLVPSQRRRECLECLALLSTILAWECECLHLCVLLLIHISPSLDEYPRWECEPGITGFFVIFPQIVTKYFYHFSNIFFK